MIAAGGMSLAMVTWLAPSAFAGFVPPTLSDNLPATLQDGAAPTTFTGTISNPGSAPGYYRVDFAITDPGSDLQSNNVTLSYDDPSTSPATVRPIPLTSDGHGGLTGYYGPAGGFQSPTGDTTSTFHVKVDNIPSTNLTVVSSLDQVGGTAPNYTFTPADSNTQSIAIDPLISVSANVPARFVSGASPSPFTITSVNSSNDSYSNVRPDLILVGQGAGFTPSNVAVTYQAVPGGPYLPATEAVDQGYPGTVDATLGTTGSAFPTNSSLPINVRVAYTGPAQSGLLTTLLDEVNPSTGVSTANLASTQNQFTVDVPTPAGSDTGYRLVAGDGGVFDYGSAAFYGSAGGLRLNKPVVASATSQSGNGYWLVASDGGVFNYGDARFYGSEGGAKLNSPIVGMARTATGLGYWLVAADGGVFTFGDATFYGSEGATKLNSPVVGIAASPDGKGYWLVAADGGIFTFGDATFHGSEGATKLNKPVVGMAAVPEASGGGYWLVASDGGVFALGDAAFHGSAGNLKLNQPVVGIVATPDGNGYGLVASDGGVFTYGSFTFHGSAGSLRLNSPVVAGS